MIVDKSADAGAADVRPDRPALRSAEPSAVAGNRSLLAAADDPAGAAAGRRPRSWTSAPGRAIWPWPTGGPAAAGCGWWAPTSAVPCCKSAGKSASAPAAATRVALVEADACRLPFPDDRFQIVCVAFGLRNVSDTDRGTLGDGPRLPAWRAGGSAGILDAHALAAAGAVPALFPLAWCRWWARLWRRTKTGPIIIFPRAWANFRRRKPWPSGCDRPGSARCGSIRSLSAWPRCTWG